MAGERQRPHVRTSIVQLEALFDEGRSNFRALRALEHELSFRTTERAAKLRAKVVDALARSPVSSEADAADSLDHDRLSEAPAGAYIPPTIDLGEFRTMVRRQGTDEPSRVIAAWTALEALSPQTYRHPVDLAGGDPRCVVDLARGRLPWSIGERSRPDHQLFYQVVLGAIPMDRATDELVKSFGEDEERGSRLREKAAIAAFLVDERGVLVEENGIAVSSFAWALPLALQLKLDALGAWSGIERKIVEKLDGVLRRVDEHGVPIPIDLKLIKMAHGWLVAQLGLPDHLVEAPTFAFRIYHHFKARNPPEPTLLNSFFLGDLARAAETIGSKSTPTGLRGYLGVDKPKQAFDLLTDRVALEKAVAPAMMPAARWPSQSGQPLVLLQQAAVNLARSELAGGEGIIAVNGPPGTGKTTLLRDIVAASVLDRALAMAAFDDPEKAFTPSGERIAAGDSALFHLYTVAPGLRGHEILVASSNNKAVENISRELPAAKAVGRPPTELSYFKSVSDLVHEPRDIRDTHEDSDSIAPEPTETWGLIAAVLGNAKNRTAFQQSFWWHKDRGFRLYLKAAKGDSVVRTIRNPETGELERHTPSVVLLEKPPSPQTAKASWRKAREQLLALKHEVDAELGALESVRLLCLRLVEVRRDLADGESELGRLKARLGQVETHGSRLRAQATSAKRASDQCEGDVARHWKVRPGLFARLFRTERWKAWSRSHAPLVGAASQAGTSLQGAERALSEFVAALNVLVRELHEAEQHVGHLRQHVAKLAGELDVHRGRLGDRLVDEQFFSKGHEESNLAAPWIPDSLHRKREDLFIAALSVHRAFVDASAQRVLHNLSVLMNVFSGGRLQDENKRKLLGDLWSTLFMVVPVLSTTFASVERMLGDLAVGSIGWLLIDEAGQALPQAAAGAIMRAKRSIVVGDPLQIPPVVTLPARLNEEICKFFKIDESTWVASVASAQTLADRASQFQAAFRSDQGPRCVGIPLLVHRRCQEPMFGISNRIAYDEQMVHAPGLSNTGTIGSVLGPSTWFDIDGEADSKWCPAEGELVVSLLKKIASAGVTWPDLFIISPFRIVAQELKLQLARETSLFSALNVDIREWTKDHIGTIHTVQGREADSVILVLGAPKASQNGARNWAAGMPNILNVAVSRAKQNLYVVGSRGAWCGVGHARELATLAHTRTSIG